ncbi:MAG TPA: acyl-CoA thioesterase domain-containing protein [Acidimicrobiales bacterium]
MTDRFTDLVVVAETGPDRFEVSSAGSGFLFGGLTMAAALAAAARTVDPSLVPRSLHAAFHNGGLWGTPLAVGVERVNDSRSYASRRAVVTQRKVAVAVVETTFRRTRGGDDVLGPPAPPARPIEELEPERVTVPEPVLEVRLAGSPRAAGSDRVHPYWARFLEPLGDDQMLHAAALAFVSDYLVIYTPFPTGSGRGEGMISRTLEHSLWFHRPIDANRWLLIDADALSVVDGHYVSRGTVHDEDGLLVASFVQEGFVRAAPAAG